MLRDGRMTRAEADMCSGKHDKDMSRTTKEIHGDRSMSCALVWSDSETFSVLLASATAKMIRSIM